MEKDQDLIAWDEVPNEHSNKWNKIFKDSTESLNLTNPCPVCDNKTLHRWYEYNQSFPHSTGALWEWCSSCGSFQHGSSQIPIWWNPPNDFNPDLSKIKIIPSTIETQRVTWEKNRIENIN